MNEMNELQIKYPTVYQLGAQCFQEEGNVKEVFPTPNYKVPRELKSQLEKAEEIAKRMITKKIGDYWDVVPPDIERMLGFDKKTSALYPIILYPHPVVSKETERLIVERLMVRYPPEVKILDKIIGEFLSGKLRDALMVSHHHKDIYIFMQRKDGVVVEVEKRNVGQYLKKGWKKFDQLINVIIYYPIVEDHKRKLVLVSKIIDSVNFPDDHNLETFLDFEKTINKFNEDTIFQVSQIIIDRFEIYALGNKHISDNILFNKKDLIKYVKEKGFIDKEFEPYDERYGGNLSKMPVWDKYTERMRED